MLLFTRNGFGGHGRIAHSPPVSPSLRTPSGIVISTSPHGVYLQHVPSAAPKASASIPNDDEGPNVTQRRLLHNLKPQSHTPLAQWARLMLLKMNELLAKIY